MTEAYLSWQSKTISALIVAYFCNQSILSGQKMYGPPAAIFWPLIFLNGWFGWSKFQKTQKDFPTRLPNSIIYMHYESKSSLNNFRG